MFIFKTAFILLNMLLFCTSLGLIQAKYLPGIESIEARDNAEEAEKEIFLEDNVEGSADLDNADDVVNDLDEGKVDDVPKLDEDKNEEDNREVGIQDEEDDEVDGKKDEEETRKIEPVEIEEDGGYLSVSDAGGDEGRKDKVEEDFVKDEDGKNVEQQDVGNDDKKDGKKTTSYDDYLKELLKLLDVIQKDLDGMIQIKNAKI